MKKERISAFIWKTTGSSTPGSGLDQITWMDVRVGDWVATPRHGKPVEINALWYNALRIMESLCEKFDEDASAYRTRANQVKESFNAKFWDSSNQCLFDVVDGDEPDDHIRQTRFMPNPFHFSLLPEEQEKSSCRACGKELFVGCGLCSRTGSSGLPWHFTAVLLQRETPLTIRELPGAFCSVDFQCLYESEPPLLLCRRKCRPHVRACEKTSDGFRLYRFHL